MKICISSGHGLHIRGASGSPVPPQLDEVDEARRMVDRIEQLLDGAGVNCLKFHDNTSHDQSTNLATITNWHNAQGDHDLDVSVHFNAYDGSAHGTEVLYVTQESLAGKVSGAIANAGGFANRGAKYRGDLYFLNNTREKAILIETCFCDNTSDSNKYNSSFEAICTVIAETISGLQIGTQPPEEIPPVEPIEPTGENRVDITGVVIGHTSIYINGVLVTGHEPCEHVVDMKIRMTGDVTVTVQGEEFHNEAVGAIKANHTGVFATTFGGAVDDEHSAYDGSYLNDTDLYVAFPYKWRDGPPPDAEVYNRATGKSAVGRTRDVGPWLTDDEAFVLGDARPLAETCHNDHEPLPRGPNAGQVPSNPAGIDLSPGMMKALGMTDNGPVDFRLIEVVTS
jgi:hypothetical protein